MPKKLIYLITRGQTSPQTTPASDDFAKVLRLVESAVAVEIDLIQIREKLVSARVLQILSQDAARITRGSLTRLLINDRPDIAAATGADGVHLRASSLPTDVTRQAFGDQLLIGASTHSLEEAISARARGADFIVLGPVFDTSSKKEYGQPLGLARFSEITSDLAGFPVIAIGGIDRAKVADCIRAGASGVAAISMLNDPSRLKTVVGDIRMQFEDAG